MAPGPVSLPDVTLIAVDSVVVELTRLAIDDTLREVTPADVIWFDEGLSSNEDVARTLWYEAPRRVKTTHVLTVQYDGWVRDGRAWRDEWLAYDYVGAPWWYKDGFNVGNGGFSLRSVELLRWLARNPGRYPHIHPEDDTICRRYRRQLELDGFVWASVEQASDFSFERSAPRPTFGFHGAYNWPYVLDPTGLERRMAVANDYVKAKIDWQELLGALRA